jgi:ABC-type nitrate/sulfonate/bicarbonate transport system permease component
MVFVSLIILSVIGMILFEIVEILQRLLCPWSMGA